MRTIREKLKTIFRRKKNKSLFFAIQKARGLFPFFLFEEVFPRYSSQQAAEDEQRHEVGKGHESVGHVSCVPDDVEMNALDVGADEEADDESNSKWINDLDPKDVLKAFFTIVTPAEKCRVAEEEGTDGNDVTAERDDGIEGRRRQSGRCQGF